MTEAIPRFVALVLVLGLSSAPVRAEDETLHENRLGDIYLSASSDSHVGVLHDPGIATPFSIYLVIDVDFADLEDVAQNDTNGVSAWEVRAALPPQLFVVDVAHHPEISADSGVAQVNVYDHVVETGTLVAAGGPKVLVEYSVLTPHRRCRTRARREPHGRG